MNNIVIYVLLFIIISCSSNNVSERKPSSKIHLSFESCTSLFKEILSFKPTQESIFKDFDFVTYTTSSKDRAQYIDSPSAIKAPTYLNMYESVKKIRMRRGTYVEDSLFSEERSALMGYQENDYREINYALRSNNQTLLSKWKMSILMITSALNKQPNYEGTLYRVAHLTKKEVNKLVEGLIIRENAFMSTTKDIKLALNRLNTHNEDIPVFYEIRSYEGKECSFTYIQSEQEVIFRPYTQFRVTSVEHQEKGIFVKLEEEN